MITKQELLRLLQEGFDDLRTRTQHVHENIARIDAVYDAVAEADRAWQGIDPYYLQRHIEEFTQGKCRA